MKGLPTDNIASAPAFSVTLDKRAVTSLTVALEPAAYRFSVTAPAWAYVMLDDDPMQRPVRLEHDARGHYVLVLGDSNKVREWFRANAEPGTRLEVRVLGPVQFWLRHV